MLNKSRPFIASIALIFLSSCAGVDDSESLVSIQKGDLVIGAEINGTLEAEESTTINAPSIPSLWRMKISYMAQEGELYKKDDRILEFDDSELQKKLRQRQNQSATAKAEIEKRLSEGRLNSQNDSLELAEAKASLKRVHLKADRPRDLSGALELKLIDLDVERELEHLEHLKEKHRLKNKRYQSDLTTLRRRKKQADEYVVRIQKSIDALKIRAPTSGTLIYKSDWQGEKKKVGDTSWRGQTIMELASLDKMKAKGEVAEVDASKIALDQSVNFRLETHQDHEMHGKITDISENIRQQNPKILLKVIDLKLTVEPNERVKTRPGMRFRGIVEEHRLRDVLFVSIEAVYPKGDKHIVYLKQNDTLVEREIIIGKQNSEFVEVIEGLNEDDIVSIGGES